MVLEFGIALPVALWFDACNKRPFLLTNIFIMFSHLSLRFSLNNDLV
jgi:hypothetical protein